MRRQPYILIAEDDADDQFLLDTAFRENRLGVKLSFVQDGIQVLEYLESINQEQTLPDLILLDVNMPLMGGPETLRRLKKSNRFKQIPVIIHSTSQNEIDKYNCLELGASGYLSKGAGFDGVQAAARFVYDFVTGREKSGDAIFEK